MDWQSNDAPTTEHQKNWWGTQRCRRCNPSGITGRPTHLVECPDCDGSGWTEWAALATEPWTEIVPNLWVGGHDYNGSWKGQTVKADAYPYDTFDLVVSMYHRLGYEPSAGVEHHEIQFNDGMLSPEIVRRATNAGRIVADGVRAGSKVLSRCQAGLNRASLVAGIAMVDLGFEGSDAVQLIRARRSPWALCNEDYAEFLSDHAQVEKALRDAERSEGVRFK